jgi:hypothetical protein
MAIASPETPGRADDNLLKQFFFSALNALCRSVTIEERFTASSRSSGSYSDWTDLYRASNSQVEEHEGQLTAE